MYKLPDIQYTDIDQEVLLQNLWFSSMTRNKVFPIIYPAGTRGHSVCRILQIHQEPDNASLQVTEDQCEYLDFCDNQSYNRKLTHASFHDLSNKIIDSNTSIEKYIENKLYKTHLLFHIAPVGSWNTDSKFDKVIERLYYSDKVYIYLYGTVDRPYFNKRTYLPIQRPNVYNINIDKLYSKDYYEFEQEYFNLVHYFNLDSKLNAVRSFILLNLERQELMAKYDTGYRQLFDESITNNTSDRLNNLFYREG